MDNQEMTFEEETKVAKKVSNIQIKPSSEEQKAAFDAVVDRYLARTNASVKSAAVDYLISLAEQDEVANGLSANAESALTDFQLYIQRFSSIFMNMLTNVKDAEDKAELKVRRILDSKDRTIANLQEEAANIKKEKEETAQKLTELTERYNAVSTDYLEYKTRTDQHVEEVEKALEEKSATVIDLTFDKTELRGKVQEMKKKCSDYDELEKEYTEAKLKLQQSNIDLEALVSKLKTQSEAHEKALQEMAERAANELAMAVREAKAAEKESYVQRVEKIREKYSQEVENAYQKLVKAETKNDELFHAYKEAQERIKELEKPKPHTTHSAK